MAHNPFHGLTQPGRRPSMQFQQLNPAFQSDPRRILGQTLMGQGTSTAPVRTPLEGLGRLSSALVGAYLQRKAGDEAVSREDKARDALLASLPANASPMLRGMVDNNPSGLQTAMATQALQPTSTLKTQELPGAPGAVVVGTESTSPLGGTTFTPSSVYKPTKPADSFRPLNASEITQYGLSDDEAQGLQINEVTNRLVGRQGAAPTVNVIQDRERTIVTESAKSGIARLDKDNEKYEKNLDLLNKLDVAKDLLAGGMETGPIQSILLPFRKIGADLNLISAEKQNDLSNQEVFNAISNYLIPRMRADGSGATSNLEGAAFAKATITIDKSPRSNAMILAGMRQLANRQNKIISEKEDWFFDKDKGNGNFIGFKKWAEENVPPAFQKFETDAELTAAIDAGTLSVGEAFYDAKNKQYEILTEDML